MRDLENTLARLRDAWMAGRPALPHCPSDWQSAVGEGAAAEAMLTALAGQAAQVAFRPAPARVPAPRPLLPRLALPPLRDALRGRARRVIGMEKGAASIVEPLLLLLAARGVSMHPADWMPEARDEWVPDLYAPWLDWTSTDTRPMPDAEISLDTYEEWPWAARRKALHDLRRRDPAAARSIIAAKAAGEAAEQRVKLVELLDAKLSDDDVPFLESLHADRSDRVKELARRFLARLGKGADSEAMAKELAATVSLGKSGIISRRHQLSVKKLKTAPMNARRRELFAAVSVAGLARALGVSEALLVETMPAGDAEGIVGFIDMVAATGSDAVRRTLLEHVIADRSWPLAHAALLAERLTLDERRVLLPAVLAADEEDFVFTRRFAGPLLGSLPLASLAAAPGFRDFAKVMHTALQGEEAKRSTADRVLTAALLNFGFLLEAPGARDLAAQCVAAGMSTAGPRLELLHLNAALKPETPS